MAISGPSVGELNTEFGIVFKIIKSTIVFAGFFGVVFLEIHLLFFGIANLFINKYNFQLKDFKSNYVANGYNNFLYHFTGVMEKISGIVSISMVIFILSVIYISFFHTKRKNFPRVIIGTLINNIIILVIFSLLCALIERYFADFKKIITPLLALIPVLYAVYLIKYKGITKNTITLFQKRKKSEKENLESFVFETKSGKIFLENPYRGIYIQGGAGSGKSASIFEPIIQQIGEKGFTGILYDFKSPELTSLIYLSYLNSAIKVKNVDFKQPLLSDRVNPIDPNYLGKSAIAMEYAQVILNNLLPESI